MAAHPYHEAMSSPVPAGRCRRTVPARTAAAALLLGAAAATAAPAADKVTVTLPESAAALVRDGADTGRMLLLFIRQGSRLGQADPLDAPFFTNPQPMASVAVPHLKPGRPVEFGADAVIFPEAFERFDGTYRVRAVFDRMTTEPGPAAPGNLTSEVAEVEFRADADDTISVDLSRAIQPEALPSIPNVEWVETPSELLSRAAGHEVKHRAAVVFPRQYGDVRAERRVWPAIYVIPGFGGDARMAGSYARMMAVDGAQAVAPQAVYVVLDPNGPYGHHGFADGDNQGPRAEALVKEFIPWLEARYRLVARPEARIVTGHSSGGWSALWLQLTHPETFGACFSSAPDPVDFSAFQASDLYTDANVFVNGEGHPQPSFRAPLGPDYDRVFMTVPQEIAMERVLGPNGDSGQQWDAWAAMFSRKDPVTGFPRRMFDPMTGMINRDVVTEEWSRYDVARMVTGNWATFGPIMRERVRLLCGTRDSFYLNRAVERLKEKLDALAARDAAAGGPAAGQRGPGYVELVPDATHETLPAISRLRWHREMTDHLKRHGLAP